MPELPEVETVVRSLKPLLEGKRLGSCRLLFPKIIRSGEKNFARRVQGQRIAGLHRRGKYILCRLASQDFLLFHLGMTGSLYLTKENAPLAKHTHLVIGLEKGPFQLRFEDPRRFGRILLLHPSELANDSTIQALGPEPLEVSLEYFLASLQSRKKRIKSLLLDQTFLAGIGNIYADESLFRSRIHPQVLSNLISRSQARRLHGNIREVLRQAIEAGGSTLRDYRDGLGRPGSFQLQYFVYGRTGKPCLRKGCQGIVTRILIGGRSSHFCPRCQPFP